MNSFEVPFSAYVSSAQKFRNHIVVDSGIAGLLSIYDTDGNLEEQFSIKKKMIVLFIESIIMITTDIILVREQFSNFFKSF